MRSAGVLAVLAVLLVLSVGAGIFVGSVALGPSEVLAALAGSNDTSGTIVRELRLPRVLGAALVGGALAAAGALLQGLLRNPLADPFVTGTSAGAALAAGAAVALGLAAPPVPIPALGGARVTVNTGWRLRRPGGGA